MYKTNVIWYKHTQRLNDEDNINEFLKKFKNTIIGFKDNQEVFFAYLIKYYKKYFYFEDEHGTVLQYHLDTELDVFIPTIQKGFYNSDVTTYLLSRYPERQWKHGITRDNLRCQPVILNKNKERTELEDTNGYLRLICKLLKLKHLKIYTHTKLTDEVFELCNTKEFHALNDKFAISLNHWSDRPDIYSLFYYQYHIGFITKDTYILLLPTLRQELLDEQLFWNTPKPRTIRIIEKLPNDWTQFIKDC